MKNDITNFSKKLYFVGQEKSVSKNEKKSIIKEALDLGFPFRDTLHISKTTYPEYIEMFYPDENLETYKLYWNSENSLEYSIGEEIDLVENEGVYGIQYKISKDLGFYSEMCFLLFYEDCYRFMDHKEAVRFMMMFDRHKRIAEVLRK